MNMHMVDLRRQYLQLREEIDAAIFRVIESCQFINGPEVQHFARELADYVGVTHAIPCASGTDALILALMALDVQPGDEVITTPFTFIATAEAISLLGAVPVFVDIDEGTLTMRPDLLEGAISPRTRVIIPVHLYGQAADLQSILEIARRHGLYVIEDAAQALGTEYRGRKVGTWGNLAAVSFYPGKNLGAYGDAGVVLTHDDQLAEKVRMLADHGSRRRYVHEYVGMNSRLDALQAAILRVKLPYLDAWNRRREEIAQMYRERLQKLGVTFQQPQEGSTHIYHQFVIRTRHRDRLQAFLNARGIPTAIHYPIPVHLQPAFKQRYGFHEGDFPVAEKVAREVLSLPMHPDLRDSEIDLVVNTIEQFFNQLAG
ncbi:MAG: DegT/DnrJ/EryC1/StrS family aminotransferase [Calditrichaeota bacterium]|nr:DegT/DnrJ/EryC1/StrS family aminotransferase [Calditrichota bacterium]